jgi:hypothetical protein
MVASLAAPAIIATSQLDAKIRENTKRMILAPARGAQGTVDSLCCPMHAGLFNANRQHLLRARSSSIGRPAARDLVFSLLSSGLSVALL